MRPLESGKNSVEGANDMMKSAGEQRLDRRIVRNLRCSEKPNHVGMVCSVYIWAPARLYVQFLSFHQHMKTWMICLTTLYQRTGLLTMANEHIPVTSDNCPFKPTEGKHIFSNGKSNLGTPSGRWLPFGSQKKHPKKTPRCRSVVGRAVWPILSDLTHRNSQHKGVRKWWRSLWFSA